MITTRLTFLGLTILTLVALAGAVEASPVGRIWLAVVVILTGTFLILRGADVRLVLFLGALPLYLAAGKLPAMVAKVAAEMANLSTVVPICSAVGFAYVLKLTECDQHLVQLLVKPLRRVRLLLIPGGIAAGYLVNTAVVSQTGAAAVVGPILIPLLRAGNVSAITAGSLLLLGCSMGGELFNPGAVEIVTLAGLTNESPPQVVRRMAAWNVSACSVALLAFWLLAIRAERRREPGPGEQATPDAEDFRVNWVKAMVPVIPLAILFAASGPLATWLATGTLAGQPKNWTGSATVLVAMLIGTAAAGLTAPGKLGKLSEAFWEGAGYGYTHVISIIVTAGTFAEAVKLSGLIDAMAHLLGRLPGIAALVVSGASAWGLAVISGSGIAPAVAFMKTLLPVAESLHVDKVRLGAAIALSAHFGRTMSPAAAVVMMSAKLSDAPPLELVKRVIPPLLLAGLALYVIVMVW